MIEIAQRAVFNPFQVSAVKLFEMMMAQKELERRLEDLGAIIQIEKPRDLNKHEITIDYIQKVVCDYFNVPVEMLQSNTRKREIVQARQIAMYFSKNLTKNSLAIIGKELGNKDHATVLHACKTVNNLYSTIYYWDQTRQIVVNYREIIDELERRLKN